ncbi:hypothetical protein ISS05_01190 [Candidatus Woesearchaeota archaeon]|nr:hypothetical protein [Candidatus Woesearchaeota archaeon]
MEDVIKLGGSIELVGFKGVDMAQMVVVRKMVGNYAKTMSEKNTGFSKLMVSLSKETDYKITAEMTADKAYVGEDTGTNLFVAFDSALKKVIEQL